MFGIRTEEMGNLKSQKIDDCLSWSKSLNQNGIVVLERGKFSLKTNF